MNNQVTFARRLMAEIEMIGVDELDVFTLLDSLACAGLKLSNDKQGKASNAWADYITEVEQCLK